jgi:endonuclease YncB( thermonuclease family)
MPDVEFGSRVRFLSLLLKRSIMKNLAIASLLFVLMIVCALPGVAQRGRPTAKPAPKSATTAPPKQPATAPATIVSQAAAAEQSGVIQGKVVDLGWGDALTVLDAQGKQHRVRLLGIDAPEKEQAFGPAARQKLSALVFGKAVSVKYPKMDRSGRPLGKVLLGALDVNLEMLKAGLAWYYANDRDLPEKDRPLYANAEREAQTAKRGLWQEESPTPPWEFRQARKKAAPPDQPGVPPGMEEASEPAQIAVETAPVKGNADADKNADVPSGHDESSTASASFPKTPKETITGDNTTRYYYRSGCPDLEKVPPQNRVSFGSIEEAEKSGFRRTPNCP